MHLFSVSVPSYTYIPTYRSLCTPSVMTPVTTTVRGWNSECFVKADGFQMWTFGEHEVQSQPSDAGAGRNAKPRAW